MEYYFYLWSFIEKQELLLSTLVRETVSKCQCVTLRNFAMHRSQLCPMLYDPMV